MKNEINTYRQNCIVLDSGKLFFNGIELPPLPSRRKGINQTVIDNKIYVNGFELTNGKWKRTFAAWLYSMFNGWL